MGEQKELTVMGKKVLEFLKDDSREIFRELESVNHGGKTEFYVTVAKVKFKDNFIRVYVANESNYGTKDLEYSGIMNLDTGKLYDLRYNLTRLGFEDKIDISDIRTELKAKINDRLKEIAIETGLKNIDKFRPQEDEIKDDLLFKRQLEDLEYRTKQDGKDAYLDNKIMDDIPFNYPYPNVDRAYANDDILLRYIKGEQNLLIEEIVNKILQEEKEKIYISYLYYLTTRKHLQDFILGIAKETEILDTIKRVTKACEGKKTVTITYEKEGKIWQGKVTVDGCGGVKTIGKGCIYDSLEDYKIFGYNITAKDRQNFYEMFGRWADIDLAHITSIKYNGKECLA